MQSSSKKSNKRPLWQFLLPPMLIASVGLHGLVLFTPVSPSEDELVPAPDPEEDGIAITKIEAPQARSPQPSPAQAGGAQGAAATAPATTAAANRAGTAGNNRSRAQTASNPNRAARTGQARRTNTNRRSSATPTRPNTDNQDDIAALPSSVDNPNPAPPTVAPSPDPDPRKRLQNYADIFATYQGLKLISAEEADEMQALWLESFTGGEAPTYPDLEIQPLGNFEKIPYEPGICLPGTPNAAQLLVLVEPDGSVNSDVMLVQSTGYRNFNTRAIALVKGHDYPAADEARAYLAEVAVDYDAENCQWPPEGEGLPGQEYFALLRAFTGPALTTPAEATAAQRDWLAGLVESDAIAPINLDDPELPALAGFTAEVPYPLNICLPIEPGTANWGVVVKPDGALAAAPERLRSTGYRSFDDQAKTLVEQFDFPAAETTQAYVVEVPVAYNDLLCQKLDSEEFVTASTPTTPAAAQSPSNEPAAATNSADQSSAVAVAADSERQQQLVEKGRQNLATSEFGSINAENPGLVAAIVESGWPEDLDRACFLSEVNPEAGPVPTELGLDAFVLTRNAELAIESLGELYGTTPTSAGSHCDADLYELQEEGVAQLFTSIIGVGAGNANALIVVWPIDPRQSQEAP